MGVIIKLSDGEKNWYLEWSKITGSPATWGMSKKEFKKYYKEEYGRYGLLDLKDRLATVKSKGTSSRISRSAEATIAGNQAGPNGTELSIAGIIEWFCHKREKPS